MFSLGSAQNYFLYRNACDMRKSFDGLCGIIINELKQNPLDGSVFVFLNRNRNQAKILFWNRDGLVIFYKRLEQGSFSYPKEYQTHSPISWPELVLLLEGINYTALKKKKRFTLKKQ